MGQRSRVRGRLPPHLALAQGQGGGLCDGDGGEIHQGPDPVGLSQPRLSGGRGLRGRGRGAALFRQIRRQPEPLRGGDDRRASDRALDAGADRQPGTVAEPGLGGGRADAPAGLSQRSGGRRRACRAGRPVRGRGAAGRGVFRRLDHGVGAGVFHPRHDRGRDHPDNAGPAAATRRRGRAAHRVRGQGARRLRRRRRPSW